MLVLITYDVSTQTPEGKKRLRQVARQCVNYGQRVQNSVFECVLDATQLTMVKNMLSKIINVEEDSLRFYNLGNNYSSRVDHIGSKPSFSVEDALVI